jgi:hypothetical protein
MPRYNRRGQEEVIFVPTLASLTLPSAAAVNGASGIVLHDVLRSMTGFTFTGTTLDASDHGSNWPKTIPGPDEAADSSMTLYEGDDPDDIERDVEAALDKGTNGFIIYSPEGHPATGLRARVWPVRVMANAPDQTTDPSTATYTVGFSHPDEPELNAVFAV